MIKIRRALISVSDKSGVLELGKALGDLGVEVLSTGGTSKALREAGIQVTDVSDVTKFPECLDGRVKTLHPGVHAGILADRSKQDHMSQLDSLDISPIDLVVEELLQVRRPGQLVFFIDDNITSNLDQAKELMRAIMPLKLRWISQSAINVAFDDEALDPVYEKQYWDPR